MAYHLTHIHFGNKELFTPTQHQSSIGNTPIQAYFNNMAVTTALLLPLSIQCIVY